MVNYARKHYILPGDRVKIEVAYSEVAMHMKVAGTVMWVELQETNWSPMVQLYDVAGFCFSLPITLGEAGIYTEGHEYYCYLAD